MSLPKPFQYKIPRRPSELDLVDRLKTPAEEELFVGEIQGMPASDLEERSARSLDRLGISYEFRRVFAGTRNQTNSAELDFMVYAGSITQPVQVDGEFAHFTGQQRSEDRFKDAVINDELRGTGALPVIRIPQRFLDTQAKSDATWDRVLAGDIGDFLNA